MLKILLTILLTVAHGTVVEEVYEGCSEHNDLYVIEVNNEQYEICADDLNEGDEVTVYFLGEYPVRVLYGWR